VHQFQSQLAVVAPVELGMEGMGPTEVTRYSGLSPPPVVVVVPVLIVVVQTPLAVIAVAPEGVVVTKQHTVGGLGPPVKVIMEEPQRLTRPHIGVREAAELARREILGLPIPASVAPVPRVLLPVLRLHMLEVAGDLVAHPHLQCQVVLVEEATAEVHLAVLPRAVPMG